MSLQVHFIAIMVFKCEFYTNCIQMNVNVMIFIFSGQCRSKQTHAYEMSITMNLILKDFIIMKVHQRVIIYK